ncbi:MAG: hypothetical protein DRH51_01215 [Candidatus Coatesbacteria bacterium]|nr:MAG: hypothetical protein DRH51_01215 [Candidatus Coatesbacteria bacterium]
MNRRVKIAVIIACCVLWALVTISVPYIMLKFSLSDDRLYALSDSYVKSLLGENATIKNAHLDLLPLPSIIISGLRTKDPEGELTAQFLKVKIDIPYLLIGRIRSENILIYGAKILITHEQSSGKIVIAGINTKETSRPLPERTLLEFRNSKVKVERIVNGNILLDGVCGSVELKEGKKNNIINMNIKWRAMSYIPSEEASSPLIPFSGSLAISTTYSKDKNRVEITGCNLNIPQNTITIKGGATRGEDGWQVSLHHTLNAGEVDGINSILSPQKYGILNRIGVSGILDAVIKTSFTLNDKGGMNNITIDGKASLVNGSIRALSVSGHKGSIEDLSMRVEIKPEMISVNDIKAAMDGRTLSGSCRVKPGGEPEYELNIDGWVDMGVVSALMKAPEEWACEGIARVMGKVEGDIESEFLPSIDAKLDHLSGSFSLPPLKERIKVNDATLIATGRTIELIDSTAKLGGGDIKAGGTLKGFIEPTITFNLNIEKLDLDRMGRKSRETKKDTDYNLTLIGKVNVGFFKSKGFVSEDLSMNIMFKNSKLSITDMHMRSYGGYIDGNMIIEIPDGDYSVVLYGSGVDIGRYLDSATEYRGIISGGKTDFTVKFRGRGTTRGEVKKTISGVGSIKSSGFSVSDLTVLNGFAEWSGLDFINRVKVDKLVGEFSMGGRELKVIRCEVAGEGIDRANLYGTIAFNGDIEMLCQLRLTKEYAEKYKGRAIALFPDAYGRGNIAFICYGTTKKPRFRLNYEQMRSLAEGLIPPLTDEVIERYRLY